MHYLCILLSLFLFVGCDKKSQEKNTDQKNESVLNIAVSSDYPPYIYNKAGKLEGFEIEIINTVAASLKKTIHFHDIAFDGILKTVEKKQVDLAISAIAKNSEREKNLVFSIPYHRSMTVIVVPLTTSIRSVNDLHDKITGVESGTTYEHDMKSMFKNIDLFARSKFSELVQALRDGKCEAIVTGYCEAYELQSNNPDLKIIPIEGTIVTFSIVLPKGSSLLQPINDKLQNMINSGEIHKLEGKFFKKIVKQ